MPSWEGVAYIMAGKKANGLKVLKGVQVKMVAVIRSLLVQFTLTRSKRLTKQKAASGRLFV